MNSNNSPFKTHMRLGTIRNPPNLRDKRNSSQWRRGEAGTRAEQLKLVKDRAEQDAEFQPQYFPGAY